MRRLLACLVPVVALAANYSGASAATCPSTQAPSAYCVPPPAASSADVAAVTTGATKALARLHPARLLAKHGVTLSTSIPGPGVLTITLRRGVSARSAVVARGSRAVGATPSGPLKLTLTASGARLLRSHHGKLRLGILTTFDPGQGAETLRVLGALTLK